MWKILTQKSMIELPSGNIDIQKEYIEREDGFTIIWENGAPHLAQTFLCKGGFGEFRFLARRWDEVENKSMDKYIVYARSCPARWQMNEKVNEQLVLAHVKDIESGLLNYPPSRFFDDEPVKSVYFDLTGLEQPPHLVLAKDI